MNTKSVKDVWEQGKNNELQFWQRVVSENGWQWPDDFENRLNPVLPLQNYVTKYLEASPNQPILILDAGSGPLTVLGKFWDKGKIEITAVDCLGDEYSKILSESDIIPLVKTQSCEVENLLTKFATNYFDLVHICNALDHSYDPVLGILQMIAVVKPGAYVLLVHAVNEGENENYEGIHQWNFDCQNGDFVIWNHSLRISVNDCLEDIADIDTVSQEGWLSVAIKKKNNIDASELNIAIKSAINFWSARTRYSEDGEIKATQLLHQLEQEKKELQAELQDSRLVIESMRNSIFWKLRTQWFRIKRIFGIYESNSLP